MRKLQLLLILMFAMMFSSYTFAQFTGDGFKQTIVGTPHDLSTNNNNGGITIGAGAVAVCEFCHAPHKMTNMGNGAGPNPPAPLLWNIQLRTGPYKLYGGSSTFIQPVGGLRDPSTASPSNLAAYMTLLCLSCHDGAITASAFYYTDPLGTVQTYVAPNIGGSASGMGLATTHPVDFQYDATVAPVGRGLQVPKAGGVTGFYVDSGTTTNHAPLPLFGDQGPTSAAGRLECATCHNPHAPDVAPNPYFLRITNTGSAICLNCHGT